MDIKKVAVEKGVTIMIKRVVNLRELATVFEINRERLRKIMSVTTSP